MITTQLIIAAGLNVTGGEQQVPIKHILNAATGAYNLEVIITNGPTAHPDFPAHPFIEVCSVTTSVADGASLPFAGELSQNRNTKTTKLKLLPGQRTFDHSDVFAVNGPFLHLWLNYGRMPPGCNIAVYVNEF